MLFTFGWLLLCDKPICFASLVNQLVFEVYEAVLISWGELLEIDTEGGSVVLLRRLIFKMADVVFITYYFDLILLLNPERGAWSRVFEEISVFNRLQESPWW